MNNAILVPGRPDKEEYYDPQTPTNSNNHWFPWLSKQLQINDIFAVAVEPPRPWQPRYDAWVKEFERFDITPDTILIGHSCGGGFLIRWLSENKDKTVGKVVLVAPWINPGNEAWGDTADFFDFTIDPHLAKRTGGVTIVNSDNDFNAIQTSVKILRSSINDIEYREFHNYGHFCLSDMKTTEFPELVQEVLGT